jgi:hypothetical protein
MVARRNSIWNPAASRSNAPARFAVNHIASARGMTGEAMAGSPPAIGNSPPKATIAVTTARKERAADLCSLIEDIPLWYKMFASAAVVEEASY